MTLNARPRRLGYRKKKRGGPKLVFVQYGFCRESKPHYEQSRASPRIYIGYALESWRQLQLERSRAGLADGCSYPNGRRVTIESYLLILPQVPLRIIKDQQSPPCWFRKAEREKPLHDSPLTLNSKEARVRIKTFITSQDITVMMYCYHITVTILHWRNIIQVLLLLTYLKYYCHYITVMK